MQLNIFKVCIAYLAIHQLSALNKQFTKENKKYCVKFSRRKMKKFRVLILSTLLNVINYFYKKLLNYSYVAKIYEQRIFFEHIFVNEAYRDVQMRFLKLRICEEFLRISKFFVINIFFEQLLKSM